MSLIHEDRKIGEGWEDPADLLAHPDNPKIHPMGQTEAVKAAIRELGWMAKIKVNKRTGYVLDGHDRIKAMMQEGLERVPVEYYDLSEEEEKLFLLTYDPIGTLFGTDKQLTEKLLHEVNAGEEALQQFLSDQAEELGIFNLDGEGESLDAEPEINRADELQKEWGTELGQVWRLPSRTEGQEHLLACGDSGDESLVGLLIGDSPPVVIFTDPPYGVSIGEKNEMLNSFQKAGKNLTSIIDDDLSPSDLKDSLLPSFTLANQYMADDCSVFVTSPQGGELGMMMMMMKEAGLLVKHVLLWVKNAQTFSMGRLDYDYKHEPILFTWGKKHRKNKGIGFKNSCWEIDKPRASAEHPTMKPVELYEQAYINHSDAGEIVYEMYCGSGTALIASENTGRQCRAVEISPAYVAVALQRYKDSFGITAELVKN